MGLPTSRDVTYVAKVTPVSANNLNAIQDQIIALNSRQLPQVLLTDRILERTIAALGTSVPFSSTIIELPGRGGVDASTRWAYAVSPGGAFLQQGSANNKIAIAAGTLFQKVAPSDGSHLSLVPFSFTGNEEFALTSGDATSPRVDLLQMMLAYDAATSTATATLSVKTGTPAASPTIPDPDAGFVPLGTVVVGHGWTTGGNAPIFGVDTAEAGNAVVHDQRMPIGIRVHRLDPTQYKLETGWALASSNQVVTASNATNRLFASCPVHLGRLIGFDLRSDTLLAPAAATLGALRNAFTSPPSTAYVKGNTVAADVGSTTPLTHMRVAAIEANHNPAAGPVIQPSAVNQIGVPLWTSGFRVPVPTTVARGWLGIGVVNQTSGTSLGEASFYIAGGF